MKTVFFAATIAFISTGAMAQSPNPSATPASPMVTPSTTCKAQAADKKLAGAAMNSFMKKCQTNASKACEADSKAKKLAGAAKTSHTKKCVDDAVGI